MGIGFRKTSALFRIAPIALLTFVVSCGGGDSGSITGGAAQTPGNTVPSPGGGTAAFTKQFGGQRFDGATCTAVDAGENIYIAGNTWGTVDAGAPNPDPTASTADIFIAKYNAAGTLQWIRQFGSPLDDYATGIAVDNTGNVIVVGYTFGDLFDENNDPQKLSSDFFILKLDPGGNQIWSLQGGTPTVDELWSVATDGNNDIFVGGGMQGDSSPFLNSGGGRLLRPPLFKRRQLAVGKGISGRRGFELQRPCHRHRLGSGSSLCGRNPFSLQGRPGG